MAIYECIGAHCILNYTEDSGESEPEPKRVVVVAQPAESSAFSAEASEPHLEKKKSGTIVALDLQLDRHSLLKLRASTAKSSELVQLKLLSAASTDSEDECELSWMIDGQVREAPVARFSRKKQVVTQLVELPRDLANDVAVAQKLAFKSCEHHWSLRRG